MKEELLHKPPPNINAEPKVYLEDQKKPWINCPECNIGPGIDHRRGCSRGHWKNFAKQPLGMSEEEVEKVKK